MKITTYSTVALVLLLLAATPAHAYEADKPSDGMPQRDHHKHDFPKAVYEFHRVLAQLWHVQPGSQRVQTTCGHVSQLRNLAANIDSVPTPGLSSGDEADWNQALQNMIVSIDRLSAACAGAERTHAEQALAGVHRAFHGVVAYLGHRH